MCCLSLGRFARWSWYGLFPPQQWLNATHVTHSLMGIDSRVLRSSLLSPSQISLVGTNPPACAVHTSCSAQHCRTHSFMNLMQLSELTFSARGLTGPILGAPAKCVV